MVCARKTKQKEENQNKTQQNSSVTPKENEKLLMLVTLHIY